MKAADGAVDDPVGLRSPNYVRFFGAALAHRMRQGFAGIRLSRGSAAWRPDAFTGRPLVVVANHPSWWDPAFIAFLAGRDLPQRALFAPIDADALQRYRFMRRCGLFGIEPDSRAGAARFLDVGRRVLALPDAVLCVTPQGRFSDVRQRPLAMRRGVAALLARTPGAIALPLALDYPFWDESRPEALARWGAPVTGHADADAWHDALTDGLERTMDALATDAQRRDPADFIALLDGKVGIGGVYDAWRRAVAWGTARRFDPSHRGRDGGRLS